MKPADKLVARIRDIRKQQAEVARALTLQSSLVCHRDTKSVGLAMGDVLRATERRLADLHCDAKQALRVEMAKLREAA